MISSFGESTNLGGNTNNNVNNTNFEKLDSLFAKARQKLYLGYTNFSILEFVVKLMHIKVISYMTDKSCDMILQSLNSFFHKGSNLPMSYYEAKKMWQDQDYDINQFKHFNLILFYFGRSIKKLINVFFVMNLGKRSMKGKTKEFPIRYCVTLY